MSDIVDKATRSRMMSRIRGKDTAIERSLRQAIFAQGFRYRLHVVRLPGKPDIVFSKYRAVVFVHGCFWHGHSGCSLFHMPGTNTEFWKTKIIGNKARDAQAQEQLKSLGWRIATVWECALRGKDAAAVAKQLGGWLEDGTSEMEIRG